MFSKQRKSKSDYCLLSMLQPYACVSFSADCLYICTEDAFPSQRLVQMERFSKYKHSEAAGKHRFTDNVFIEHLTDKVR